MDRIVLTLFAEARDDRTGGGRRSTWSPNGRRFGFVRDQQLVSRRHSHLAFVVVETDSTERHRRAGPPSLPGNCDVTERRIAEPS